jgi:hypothetical protein
LDDVLGGGAVTEHDVGEADQAEGMSPVQRRHRQVGTGLSPLEVKVHETETRPANVPLLRPASQIAEPIRRQKAVCGRHEALKAR